jgi:hypothetical protein
MFLLGHDFSGAAEKGKIPKGRLNLAQDAILGPELKMIAQAVRAAISSGLPEWMRNED